MGLRTAAMIVVGTGLLSGCVPQTFEEGQTAASGSRLSAPQSPANIPPRVRAALPAGMSPDFLMRDASGCWTVVLEQSSPPMGVPLRDDLGQLVCGA